MTLSRRDRAACALALEWCRASDEMWSAYFALSHRGLGVGHLAATLEPLLKHQSQARGLTNKGRFLRARLALYLRALLRADAGDCGGRHEDALCATCGGNATHQTGPWTWRITPLWQLARPTL